MKKAVILFIILLSACSSRKETLFFNLGVESVQLDWNKTNDSASVIVLDNIMEGLTSYVDSLHGGHSELLRPGPALATSWSVLEGGKRYLFHLRGDVVWSDGVPLEAKHFVDSWQRLLDPATKSETAFHLFHIVGAEEFASGKIRDFSQVGVKALDSKTLEVRLRYPVSYFLHLVSTVNTFPIRKELIAKFGTQWSEPHNLVTLGAYGIEKWSPGEYIELVRSSKYWDKDIYLKTVRCKMVSEPITALTLYENNEIDILPRDLPISYMRYWQKHSDYRTGAKLSVSYLAFNVKKPPFTNVKSRKIFISAINRDQLAEFFGGAQTASSSWIPPGLLGYNQAAGIVNAPKQTEAFVGLKNI